jgi:hypothetical protein
MVAARTSKTSVDATWRHGDRAVPTLREARATRVVVPDARTPRTGHRRGIERRALRRGAAVLAAIGFAGIALFQLALVAGAPWGHAAWGGESAHLSTGQRLGSTVSALLWTLAALLVLACAGVLGVDGRAKLFRRGTWFVVVLLALSAVVNFASPSRWENVVFGPLALVLAALCSVVARTPREGAG